MAEYNQQYGETRPAFRTMNADPPEIKNPQLVKLYADLQKKSILVGFWLNFCAITIVIYILTLAIPGAVLTQTSYLNECPTNIAAYYPELCAQAQTSISSSTSQTNQNLWLGLIPGVSPLNQMIFLSVTFIKNSSVIVNRAETITLNVTVAMLAAYSGEDYQRTYHQTNSIQIDCTDMGSNQCAEKYLAYVSDVSAQKYFFIISFANNNPEISTWAASYQMKFNTMNPEYSKFLLALRYTLVVISIVANFLYIRRIKMIPYHDLVIEQKLLFVMGLLLILFNDPFAGLTVLYPNVAAGFFGVFFTINFCVVLLLFWLVTFQRIFAENDRKETQSFTIWKLAFISLIWIFLFIPYFLLTVMKVANPVVGFDQSINDAYDVFKYLGLILVGIYCGTLLNYYIRICKVYESRLWRHKTLFSFSNYFLFAILLFIFTGALDLRSRNGAGLFMVITILNMYIYFLQFLYSPTSLGIKVQFVSVEQALKYNAFDALDDKDEDLNINFEDPNHRRDHEAANEIEIHQAPNRKPNQLQVINFNEQSSSENKIEDLNLSQGRKVDVFN